MALSQMNRSTFGRELALVKPLGWMAVLAVIMLLIVVIYLSIRGEGGGPNFAPQFKLGDGEVLVMGTDVIVTPMPGAPKETNVQGFTAINSLSVTMRTPELKFSVPFVATFPIPEGQRLLMAGPASNRPYIAQFDNDSHTWRRVPAFMEEGEVPALVLSTTEPGIYALGLGEVEKVPYAPPVIDRSRAAEVRRSLPNFEVFQHEGKTYVSIGRKLETGFQAEPGFGLALQSVLPLQQGSKVEVLVSSASGENPAWLTADLSISWYVLPSLAEYGVAEADAIVQASDPSAFSFMLDETYTADVGPLYLIYEIHDVADHGELVAQAWMPIDVVATPTEESDAGE